MVTIHFILQGGKMNKKWEDLFIDKTYTEEFKLFLHSEFVNSINTTKIILLKFCGQSLQAFNVSYLAASLSPSTVGTTE